MKSIIMALAILSTTVAFAAPSDCAKLVGKFNCTYEEEQVGLRVSIVGIKAAIEINGEAQIYILDGVEHASGIDDSQNKASCTNKELIVENTFQGELKAMTSISALDKGVQLTLVKDAGSIELTCSKVK